LGGLGSEIGGALGSQGGGVCYGMLNLARDGLVAVNLREREPSGFFGRGQRNRAAPFALALKGEEEASPGRPRRLAAQAGKQAACLHARGGRAGQGAGDPHRITIADPYPLFSVPLQNSAKT
jgi:hypothetical protein